MKSSPLPPVTSSPIIATGNFPWHPDMGNGSYRNPILYADYSDPDVIRHGDDFYMVSSSFNCTPALPILHSRDLVNWQLVNHALKNLPVARYGEVQPGCGVWAPAIRHHAGKFWIFFPMPDEGIYVITAPDPTGRWSEPHLVHAGKGLIDPCPFWDDDGQTYLVHAYAGSRAGIKHRLRICPLAPDGSRLLGEGQIIFHEPEKHPTVEGPKFHKRDGWYYLLAPAGGVATGWQLVLRSRNIFGPYEAKVVLAQGTTPINGPHQGALVDTATGEWWFLHFQDAGLYGRVVHLQPVQWQDGWPLIGIANASGVGEPALEHRKPNLPAPVQFEAPATTDEFTGSQLGLQWQWQANHHDNWYSLTARPGWLRLFPQLDTNSALKQTPNLLLQKFPARAFTVETLVELDAAAVGDEAGLVIAGQACAALAVVRTSAGYELTYRSAGCRMPLQASDTGAVRLRVTVKAGGECIFAYATSREDFKTVPESFQAQAGVWIGAKVGIYSTRTRTSEGRADFDHFRFGRASC